ncbi:MAG: hypothetical protein KIT34_02945 [Cyanobacteria bacterium TGS_CYA1]|nr:hypothetical protein [Cyanobacteria bacterium TGS_CYA1]
MRVISFVFCLTILFLSGFFLDAHAKYVFKPGSRQAIWVPDNQAASGVEYNKQGYSRNASSITQTGGMSVRRGMSPPSISPGSISSSPSGRIVQKRSSNSISSEFTDYVEVQGLKRPFSYHLPCTYNRARSTPVVLVFAGLKMKGTDMIAATGMNGVSNRNNFIVVYGEPVGGEWQDGMKNRAYDDVLYVQAVLTKLGTICNIDSHRVYAVGLSNGGFFCQLLACSMPSKIAAIAVVSATGMEQALQKSGGERAMPCMFFLGTDDPLINWQDGKTKTLGKYAKRLGVSEIDPALLDIARYGGFYSVPDLISFWTNHNRCAGSPAESYEPDKDPHDGMRVKKSLWGHRGNAVVLYTIEGGGHTWPGCIFLSRNQKCCQDIDTSEIIWKFFQGESR